MAERSTKIMATIPDKYSPDFAERLDKRTSIAKAICGRIETIETDMGGHTQAVNTLIGLFRLLGLERRQRPVERLRDVMRAAEPDAAASEPETETPAEPA